MFVLSHRRQLANIRLRCIGASKRTLEITGSGSKLPPIANQFFFLSMHAPSPKFYGNPLTTFRIIYLMQIDRKVGTIIHRPLRGGNNFN